MARGRPPPTSRDHRPADPPSHPSRSRRHSRSPSPHRSTNRHSHTEPGRSPPSRPKELFPNRYQSSPERDNPQFFARGTPVVHPSGHRGRRRDDEIRDRVREPSRREPLSLDPYFDESNPRNHPRPSSPPRPSHKPESRARSPLQQKTRREDNYSVEHRKKSPVRSKGETKHHDSSHQSRGLAHHSSQKRLRSRSPSRSRDHKSAKHHELSSHKTLHRTQPFHHEREPVKLGRHTVVKDSSIDDNGKTQGESTNPKRVEATTAQHKRSIKAFSPSSDHAPHKDSKERRISRSPRGRSEKGRHNPDGFSQDPRHPGRPLHEDTRAPPESHPKKHRSRSRSVNSIVSRASYRNRPRGESPEMYNNHSYSRGRQYSSGNRQYSNSPPHHYSHSGQGYHGDYRGGWNARGSPPMGYHGQHSPPHSSYNQPPSPYYQSNSHSQSQHSSAFGNGSGRGRGNAATSARAHFQNLSWTPDKGSRGGLAPSERRLPPRRDSESAVDNTSGPPPDAGTSLDDDSTRTKAEQRGREELRDESSKEESRFGNMSAMDGSRNAASTSQDDNTSSAAKQTSIKFAMKAPTQPALAKRPNVIQSAPKAPSRSSVFQPPESEDKLRRTEFATSRGKPPPPRFNNSRYDDYGVPKHPRDFRPERDPYRSERPIPSSHRDRRGYDNRDFEPRPRGKFQRDPPKTLKSSRPRRKKFKKVMKKHRRVLLPPRTLPKQWAESDFVYYPKPDRNSVVGAGTYGKVFKAHNVYLNKCVALKTLPLIKPRRKPGTREYVSRDKKRKRQERWVKDGLHLTSLREVKLLKSISHQDDNIVGIREIFLEGMSCNLVFDYFEFDMHGIIYSAKVGLGDSMMKDLVLQVFRGLDYLHTKANILHRDIKAANILVSAHGQVRITDFGLAKHVKEPTELDTLSWYRKKFEHSNRVITTPYRPPELLLGATLYGGEVDVWSAGCVLFEAFLRKLPFQGTGEDSDHLLTIWKILGLPNVNLYPEVVDLEWFWLFMSRVHPKKSIFARLYKNKVSPQLYHLLRCIFQLDPKKRPTAAQVLTHPFFTSELPLPECARPVLENVEGEWHELEYKMIRDKEKASVRQKHEDNVIMEYLKHKQLDHERRIETAGEIEMENHASRVEFYKSEQTSFQARIEAREQLAETEDDHAKQVAEMKKTHGDMYMDAARRGRYRGVGREKMDEKLLQEAFRWYEEEKKKGNNPVPHVPVVSKVRVQERARQPKETQSTKEEGQRSSMSRSVPKGETDRSLTIGTVDDERRERKQEDYQRRKAEYDRQLAKYQRQVAQRQHNSRISSNDKREAGSPLVDERERKKMRE